MSCPPSNIKFQLRRATSTQWMTVPGLVLQAGEPGFETDTYNLKIGDGITPWYSLPYVNARMSGYGPTGPTGPTTSYIFDGGSSTSNYTLGPAFDCGSSI